METETFQHYQILRRDDGSLWELGRGAMAVTYKAVDNNLCCSVALKVVSVLNLNDAHTRARFVREARAAAALRHRNIASVYHLGNDEQSYFYAMEFVDGETVEDLVIRRGPLPAAEALDIAAQVARALGAAAKQGLVHRDIKPANLMVVREDDDESLIVKVIDFGLARRAVVTDASAQITLSGFVGTPQYASPEQIEERDLDTRSDIYSLGVTLWFMLTGQPTFSGPLARISSQHLNGEPPWAVVAHLPAPVRDLLARMLQKSPADRPQTPGQLRREIEACVEALPAAPSTGTAPTPPPEVSTNGDTTLSPEAGEATRVPPAEFTDDEPGAEEPPDAFATSTPPTAGERFGERFYLSELIGEGSTGQVFRATDARRNERPVALKILRSDLGLGRVEFHHLQGDLRRLRAAPHPRLIEVFALDQARGYHFMATEWIEGFTIVDLLRRRGRLELPEALRLLEDASDAAAHGSANGLHRLELAPHQILVHFPAGFGGDKARAIRAIIDRPLTQWPGFGLKIDAVAPARDMGRTPTWAGAATLVPSSRQPGRDTQSSIRGLVEGSYFYALGALLYETLNGTAPPRNPADGREVPPLPMLGEEGNDLLQRALSANPGFRNEREFFDALLTACGLERGDLRVKPTSDPPVSYAAAATVVPSAEPVVIAASTASANSPAPPRMAPTIRTKLLRPRKGKTTLPATSHAGNAARRIPPLAIAAGAVGCVAVAAVGGFLLLPKHPAPAPPPVPVESPAAPVDEAESPSPSPASVEPMSPTPP